MEEQAFRRLPPRLSDALVHKFPSMLEYKSPTTLEMPEVVTYLVEDPDPDGPFGAKEVGQGPLLPDHARRGERRLRRGGRAHRRGPDHAREGAAGARREGARAKPAATGPRAFPDVQWPEPLERAAARGRAATARAINEPSARHAEPTRAAPVAPEEVPP